MIWSRRRIGFLKCFATLLLAGVCLIPVVRACGPYLTLRAYLTRSFWLPMYYSMNTLIPQTTGKLYSPLPYAGFSAKQAPPSLIKLREAYRQLMAPEGETEWTSAALAAKRALAPGTLTGSDLEEARLIDYKIALRGSSKEEHDLAALQIKFEEFIRTASNKAFISEGRGWLARVYYLQRKYVDAARIYLDELDSTDSPLSHDTLVSSLHWTYSKGQTEFWDRSEMFFDTPRHALFLVNLATNPKSEWESQNDKRADERGRKVLNLLQKHSELFKSGEDSEALIMALMRASLYLGDPGAALKYAAAASGSRNLQQNPEFNWMTAIACVVKEDYRRAETPLQRMLKAPSSTGADRRTAAQGLIGVYLKTGRPVEALRAAFIQESTPLEEDQEFTNLQSPRQQWFFYGLDLNLADLLDSRLTEEELRGYLGKYAKSEDPVLPVWISGFRKILPASQVVRYSLAVRLARKEEYQMAAEIYRGLGFDTRAGRMTAAGDLLDHSKKASLTDAERGVALFEYGKYIAENPERLYFNDLLWHGFQRKAFLEPGDAEPSGSPRWQPGFTQKEREEILGHDRKLRDEQEERWKAFKILESIPEHSDRMLGRKAARKIIACLEHINIERFGRGREIRTALTRWRSWLRANPANAESDRTKIPD